MTHSTVNRDHDGLAAAAGRPAQSRPPGFALVVTVTLMLLLSVLIVGLLGLSSATLRASSQQRHAAEARANARLALMLALGELQTQLGPDQRISAPSAILEDPTTPQSSLKHPALTGVWRSRDDALGTRPDYDRETPFLGWLVSNPAPEGSKKLNFASLGSFENPATLVSERKREGTGNAIAAVTAGRIKLPSTTVTGSGSAAWWIGDENCKGFTAPDDSHANIPQPDINDILDATATPGGAGMLAVDNAFPVNTPQASMALSHGSLGLIASQGPQAAARWFHDLSPHAKSILCNVSKGGLRHDLSLFLENPAFDTTPWPGSGANASPAGPNRKIALSPADEYDVLSWKSLYHYYHMKRKVAITAGRPTLTTYSGSAYGNTDYQATFDMRGNHAKRSDGNWGLFLWSSKLSWRYERNSPSPSKLPVNNLPGASFGELRNAPRPFMVVDIQLKALDESEYPNKIGNSFASPGVPADAVRSPSGWPFWVDMYINTHGGTISGQKFNQGTFHTRPNIDRSYAANHLLWDQYFFSSMAAKDSLMRPAGARSTVDRVVREFLTNGKPLANERYKPYLSRPATRAVTELVARGSPTPTGHLKAAGVLMVEGGFNVNSTSLEAWKTVIASTHRRRVAILDTTGGRPRTTDPGNFIVSRFTLPNAGSADAAAGRSREALRWLGYRELTEAQIESLAEAIVRQVKLRGPFRSLGEFVNRRLAGENDERSLSGALQAALDDPASGINNDYLSDRITAEDIASAAFQNRSAALGSRYQGSPATITQADLLGPIAPVLNARSDTFVVRGYGESLDASGRVTARAWCEAVVQRLPDYFDPADLPEVTTLGLKSDLNKRFGRQMKMISFRWLSPDEV